MAKFYEEDFKPNHNYQWALSMAKQGCHCVCSQLKPGERLVYTTKASIRTYLRHNANRTTCAARSQDVLYLGFVARRLTTEYC